MRKVIFALIALMFVSGPARADVIISAETDGCVVTVSFDASSETNLVRAFALDIQLSNDANIFDVRGINNDYYIYPGSIEIDAATGEVTSYGSIVCDSSFPDTLPGLGSNGITIEMGSLYAPVGPASPNAPATSGELFKFTVDRGCTVTISANVSRAGPKGVVMEDPDESPTVVLPEPLMAYCGCCCLDVGFIIGDIYITEEIYNLWLSLGCPIEWCCESNSRGDANMDEFTNPSDVVPIINALGQVTDPTNYLADLNRDGFINPSDVVLIINNLGAYVGPCPGL